MSECGPDCKCGKNIVIDEKPTTTTALRPRCRITLRGGERIEIDKSATRIKHMRRVGGVLPLQGPSGNRIAIRATDIVGIESLAPAETEAYSPIDDGNLFARPARPRRGFRLLLSFLS